MKKRLSLSVILVLFITSLACQTLSSFSEGNQEFTLVPSVTTVPTEVVDLAPSTEGWIAILNENNLWLIHPDGSGLKQITNNPFPAKSDQIIMKWAPYGQKLAFTQGGGLYILDLSTFTSSLLVENTGGSFDWSSTGGEIIYSTPPSTSDPWSDNGLWVINLEDGQKRQVVEPSDKNRGFWNPEWSSDGRYLIFANLGWEISNLKVMDLTTGNFVDLPLNINGGSGFGGCEWAPSEVVIACTTMSDDLPRKTELRLINTDGNIKQTISLPDEIGMPSIRWSSDGKEMAMGYYSKAAPSTSVFSFNDNAVRFLASGIPSDWSPDGKWVLTWISENNVPTKTFVVNSTSGESFSLSEGWLALWQPYEAETVMSQNVTSATQQPEAAPTLEGVTEGANTPSLTGLLCTDVYITVDHTPKGDFLQICSGSNQYEIGPLEKGAFAIGPNKKFFVYATNSGNVYASRFGSPTMDLIGDVKDFSIIVREEAPQYEFEFFGDHPYTVQINEMILKQNKTLSIPRYITTSN